MTEYTNNYGLNKYSDGDAANLRDQYNASMDIIDGKLKTASDNAQNAVNASTQNTSKINDINDNLSALHADTAENAGSLYEKIVTASSNAQNAVDASAQNAKNIAAINNNLNALHADTAENAGSLYEKIVTAETSLRNTPIVFIGDSITQGYGATNPGEDRWPKLLCDYYNATQVNHAVGGSGFTVNGSQANGRFDIQAQTCANDNSFDHSLVRCVFIAGGVNDGAVSSYATADQVATACVSIVRNAFPNAKIYAIIGLSGSLKYGGHSAGNTPIVSRLKYYNHLIDLFKNLNCATVPGWLVYSLNSIYQSADCLHPNTKGYRLIAGTIINLMNGGVFHPQSQGWTWTLTNNSNNTSYLNISLDEGSMNINTRLDYTVKEGDEGAGTRRVSVAKLISLPDFFRAGVKNSQNIYIPSCVYLNTYFYTSVGYASISTVDGVSWINLYAEATGSSATISAGTTVSAIFNITVPLFGS